MSTTYLPVQPFEVEKIHFYVIGTLQSAQGFLAPLYQFISKFTGRRQIDLRLVALTDQETASNFMDQMGRYEKKYVRQAVQLARKRGFFVTGTRWDGIIHPDNLAAERNAPDRVVWEFPPG